MQQPQIDPNPFALMMDPEAVLQAVEASARLGGLQRRIYRPLDRPTLARHSAAPITDDEIDAADDSSMD